MDTNKFYENTFIYDAAFDDRDFKLECDFLEWCFENNARVKKDDLEKKMFIELACGPAKHARLMADRDWKSYGLDISQDMLDYAEKKAEEDAVKVKLIKADMINFRLKKQVHLAANLLESIAHITTNEQMVKHLRSVSKNLVKGGIYVIEATHPRYFCPDGLPNTWTFEKDGKTVEFTFGTPEDTYEIINQRWLTTSRIKVTDEQGNISVEENTFYTRWYLAQEIKALIELSNAFSKVWFYGSLYSIPPNKLDDSDSSDSMVIVLRK